MDNFKVETNDPHEFTMEVGGHRVTVPYLSPEEKQRYAAKKEGPVTSVPGDVNFVALQEDLVKASAQYLTMMNEMNEQYGGGPDQVPDLTPALDLSPDPVLDLALDFALDPAVTPGMAVTLAQAQVQSLALAPAPVPIDQMGGIPANRSLWVNQRRSMPNFATNSPALYRPHSELVKVNSPMASPAMNRPYSDSVMDKPINGCTVPGCPAKTGSKCPINGCFIKGCSANKHPASGCPVSRCPSNGHSANGYTSNGYPANGYTVNGYTTTGYPTNQMVQYPFGQQ
jgi:hypothetical protein